jgi:hypothetical protein
MKKPLILSKTFSEVFDNPPKGAKGVGLKKGKTSMRKKTIASTFPKSGKSSAK